MNFYTCILSPFTLLTISVGVLSLNTVPTNITPQPSPGKHHWPTFRLSYSSVSVCWGAPQLNSDERDYLGRKVNVHSFEKQCYQGCRRMVLRMCRTGYIDQSQRNKKKCNPKPMWFQETKTGHFPSKAVICN